MFKETFTIAIKAIFANKTRSGLTMLGIIIGVGAVILLVSIGSGLQSFINSQFEDLGSNLIIVMPGKVKFGNASGPPNFASSKLSKARLEEIRRLGEVKAVAGVMEAQATVKYKNKSLITQIQAEDGQVHLVINKKVTSGRYIVKQDVLAKKRVTTIGSTVAEELFGKENPVGKSVTIEKQKFKVVGVREKKGASGTLDVDNYVELPYTVGKTIIGMDNFTSFIAIPKEEAGVELAKRRIKQTLLRNLTKDDFTIMNQEELLGTITQILGVLTAALGGIAAISLVVGGVGIMNIMLVSVTERTREIGIRKAVGAKRQDILMQFLVEAVTLSLLGGLAGIALGLAGSALLGKFLQTAVTPESVALSFGVSATIGIVFGIAPAYKASRKSAIDALRYE